MNEQQKDVLEQRFIVEWEQSCLGVCYSPRCLATCKRWQLTEAQIQELED